jgi:hypothetical protein
MCVWHDPKEYNGGRTCKIEGTVIQTAIPVGRLGNKTLLIFYEDRLLYKKCEKRVSIV